MLRPFFFFSYTFLSLSVCFGRLRIIEVLLVSLKNAVIFHICLMFTVLGLAKNCVATLGEKTPALILNKARC